MSNKLRCITYMANYFILQEKKRCNSIHGQRLRWILLRRLEIWIVSCMEWIKNFKNEMVIGSSWKSGFILTFRDLCKKSLFAIKERNKLSISVIYKYLTQNGSYRLLQASFWFPVISHGPLFASQTRKNHWSISLLVASQTVKLCGYYKARQVMSLKVI